MPSLLTPALRMPPLLTHLRRFLAFFACTLGLLLAAPAALAATAADSLDTALNHAAPGDVILVSGIHTGRFKTWVAGTASAPITVRGDGTAVLQGDTTGYGVTVLHDYYRFENLTLRDYKKGFMVAGASHGIARRVHVDGTQEEAFKIHHPTSSTVSNTPSQYWLFIDCSARNTGRAGTVPGTAYGEGFYTGDAANNWYQNQPDTSGYVTFYNCYVTNTRNDGWDAKEGAHHIKLVNCTQDYSGPIEPAANDALGFSGCYCRADHVQFANVRCLALGNGGPAFKLYQQTAGDGVTYGHDMVLKNVAAEDLTGALAHIHNSAVGVTLYDDYALSPIGAALYTTTTHATTAATSSFAEMTWPGEGGGLYAALNPTRGAFGPGPNGDPLTLRPPAVAAPVFSLAPGAYFGAQSLALSSATAGAVLRYTTDGSAPSPSHGTLYSGPLSIAATTTIRAVACFTEPLPDDATVVLAPYVSPVAALELTIVAPTYAGWCSTRFTPDEVAGGRLAGPTADPDDDGCSNLLEYAFGREPRQPDADGLPSVAATDHAGVKHLFVTAPRRQPLGDLTYEVQASTDLVHWAATATEETARIDHGATVTITARELAPIAAPPRRFLRIVVRIPGGG